MNWKYILKTILQLATSLGIRLLLSGIYMLVGIRLIKWVSKWIKTSPRFSKVEDGARSFISAVASVLMYIVLFITVAVTLGIPTTSFIAALASLFAAIGLAMQGTLSNFAGGVMILIFKPFRVGEYIVYVSENVEGVVVDITLVYTVLRTYDNQEITIPNGALTNSVVKNLTSVNKRRVDLNFSAPYDTDVDTVKKILSDIINAHPKVLKDPAPTARLSEHGKDALVYSVRAWCNTEDYFDVRFDVLEQVKREFDKNDIEIPFTQVDVHLDK